MMSTFLTVPNVSKVCNAFHIIRALITQLTLRKAELASFHEAHFSAVTVADFEAVFLPVSATADQCKLEEQDADCGDDYEDEHEDEDEDDGLGYYEDGVKRTLTDEQIAMFRHSELETLRRELEQGQSRAVDTVSNTGQSATDLEDGEDSDSAGVAVPDPDVSSSTKRKQPELNRKKKRRRKGRNKEPEERIDLRKRTWDMVDKGLESLDYGDD